VEEEKSAAEIVQQLVMIEAHSTAVLVLDHELGNRGAENSPKGLGIALAIRLIPAEVLDEARKTNGGAGTRIKKPTPCRMRERALIFKL